MGGVSDFLFGSDDPAEQAQKDVKQSTAQARQDIFDIFPTSDVNRNLGLQAALDQLQRGTTTQMATQRAGNFAAQEALQGGRKQFQNAILGSPVSQQAFDPTFISPNLGFLEAQLPQFQSVTTPQQQQQQQLSQALQVLGGLGSGFFEQGGDMANVPDFGIDIANMSSGEKAQAVKDLQMFSLAAPFPLNIPTMIAKSLFSQDLSEQAVDAGNPQGAPGFGGTGSGTGAGVGMGAGFGGTGVDFGGV